MVALGQSHQSDLTAGYLDYHPTLWDNRSQQHEGDLLRPRGGPVSATVKSSVPQIIRLFLAAGPRALGPQFNRLRAIFCWPRGNWQDQPGGSDANTTVLADEGRDRAGNFDRRRSAHHDVASAGDHHVGRSHGYVELD